GTIPVNRAVISLTRTGSPSRSRRMTCDTASASVAEPWRIGVDSPASRATATSVWMGFQMRAHSEYTLAAQGATEIASVQRVSVPVRAGGVGTAGHWEKTEKSGWATGPAGA